MTDILRITHDRVDDLPVIFELVCRLNLPTLLDRCLGTHGLHQGLSNGWLAAVWLVYILSEADHRKAEVQTWAEGHQLTLERLLGEPLRPTDFSDDRLGIVLRRLAQTEGWEALEAALWQQTVSVHAPFGELEQVRLDSTTVSGYHVSDTEGLMQRGHSKDHRPDLAQLKLMAAAAQPTGHLLGADVLPGNVGDDRQYLPLIKRVQHMLGRSGLLYAGDTKMSSLATRAALAGAGDYYLTPLPSHGVRNQASAAWIETLINGSDSLTQATLVWKGERYLGGGIEFERAQTSADGSVSWVERVLIFHSRDAAGSSAKTLERHLQTAETQLTALMSTPGRGQRVLATEAALLERVQQVLDKQRVGGLLKVSYAAEQTPKGPRFRVTGLTRDQDAITAAIVRLGWQVLVTNLPADRVSFTDATLTYRAGWCLERDFHLIKDRPLGIRPLYVRTDEQILGLTRLLCLGLRLMTLFETQVRANLNRAGASLAGLYAGQPKLATNHPTTSAMLRAFVRTQVTLTRIDLEDRQHWSITPLPPLLEQILSYLGAPPDLYARLATPT